MAINLTDLLESGPGAVGQTDTAEAVPPITNANRQSNSLAEETSPSTNFASPTPPVDGPHDRRRYNYYCVVCGRPHDRAERARDCSNRDLGLTPHACGGQCGTTNCTKVYSSEALLRQHLARPQDRDVQCPKWFVFLFILGRFCLLIPSNSSLRTVRRKNIARHRKEACY
ncbi:hypothetical protein M408DRAFT_208561 [Serendipita vermifera MAFF 305830]|uniref:Uncharacterized protein n=1 Tax=Serendipita vermifera MAFF 305830 TaxID=933852 RepID=A0A0C2WGQ1_SERVB|nr:hypothetical protein M408DRAFT_208561 [Serendipita vermifera MAFF 305830]